VSPLTAGWGVNPVALAQLLQGDLLPPGDWSKVEQQLLRTFNVAEVRHLFEARGSERPLLDALDALAHEREPRAWRGIENLEVVKQAMLAVRDPELIRPLLPILMPVADAVFTTPDDPAAAEGVRVAGFYGRSMSNYITGDVSWLDPKQGIAADCYLVAAMIALAWSRPAEWSAQVRGQAESGRTGGRHRIAFYEAANQLKEFRVGPRLPEIKALPIYAHCTDKTEAWAAMVEKAFVMWRAGRPDQDPLPMHYRLISDEPVLPHMACRALLGGAANVAGPYTLRPLDAVIERCDPRGVTRVPTMAWTWGDAAWQLLNPLQDLGFARTGLVANHAYAVLGILPATPQSDPKPDYVVLRNPWGIAPYSSEGHALGPWRPGPGANGAAEVELNSNGVFALKAQWFNDCFYKVGWVDS